MFGRSAFSPGAGFNMGLGGGSLNADKGGAMGRVAKPSPNDGFLDGDFTLQDPRINEGKPTNVPTKFGNVVAPFARNDPRFRDWLIENAIKSKKRFRPYGTLQEALEAAKAYGAR